MRPPDDPTLIAGEKAPAFGRSIRSARGREIGLGMLAACVAAIYVGLIWTMRRFDSRPHRVSCIGLEGNGKFSTASVRTATAPARKS